MGMATCHSHESHNPSQGVFSHFPRTYADVMCVALTVVANVWQASVRMGPKKKSKTGQHLRQPSTGEGQSRQPSTGEGQSPNHPLFA